jgi:hypothetical protein
VILIAQVSLLKGFFNHTIGPYQAVSEATHRGDTFLSPAL